jgi:hypothetical protein
LDLAQTGKGEEDNRGKKGSQMLSCTGERHPASPVAVTAESILPQYHAKVWMFRIWKVKSRSNLGCHANN